MADPQAYAQAQSVSPTMNFYRKCLVFVRTALGIKAGAASAQDAWNATPAADRFYDADPPPNVPVYFSGNHVALSAGNGNVWSTDIHGAGTVSLVSMTELEKKWGKKYLGWADTLNGQPVRPGPPPTRALGGGSSVSGTVSDSDIYRLAASQFSPDQAVTMTAIALAESGGNPRNVGDKSLSTYGSRGLWQIFTGVHSPAEVGLGNGGWNSSKITQLEDPANNIVAARDIYKSQGFKAWSTYKDGAYKKYLSRAMKARQDAGATNSTAPTTPGVAPDQAATIGTEATLLAAFSADDQAAYQALPASDKAKILGISPSDIAAYGGGAGATAVEGEAAASALSKVIGISAAGAKLLGRNWKSIGKVLGIGAAADVVFGGPGADAITGGISGAFKKIVTSTEGKRIAAGIIAVLIFVIFLHSEV